MQSRKLLSWYQIVGGAAGIIAIDWAYPSLFAQAEAGARAALTLTMLAASLPFALTVVSGILLDRRKRGATTIGLVLQALQVPIVSLSGSSWVFLAGPYLGPLWRGGRMTLAFGISAKIEMGATGADATTMIGVNLVPLAVAWLILRLARRGLELGNTQIRTEPLADA